MITTLGGKKNLKIQFDAVVQVKIDNGKKIEDEKYELNQHQSLSLSLKHKDLYFYFSDPYPWSWCVTVLSSVTLYIMDGSSDTFSMNMGDVVMFWIWASRNTSSVWGGEGGMQTVMGRQSLHHGFGAGGSIFGCFVFLGPSNVSENNKLDQL